MLIIWGKRTYGSVQRVGNISVKTIFGHLWGLPLIPMTSYYVDAKSKAAYELNGLNWRSVLFGYMRVWLPVVVVITFLTLIESEPSRQNITGWLTVAIGSALMIGTYLYDKTKRTQDIVTLREAMQRHFGVALDPFECLVSLQNEIDQKTQSNHTDRLEPSWYKEAIKDAFTNKQTLELALLRARCDQHDLPLQHQVLQNVRRAA